MKRLLIVLTLLFALTACNLATETPTIAPSDTPEGTQTATVAPTGTNTPTPTLTPSPGVTPQPIPWQDVPELLTNRDFEPPYYAHTFGEVRVAGGWKPFYCDTPYTPEKCPAERIGDGNPDGLEMGRPEFKPTDVTERVTGGWAQQWFCFFRTCRAGVYQTVNTQPGQECRARAWVQSWSAGNETGSDGVLYHSWDDNPDARAASQWRILVDGDGGEFAWGDGVQESRVFGYGDGHYDAYVQIEYPFTATSNRTTIFYENLRLWPFAHNDSYIDHASVKCRSTAPVPVTPEPPATPTIRPTPTRVPSSTPTPGITPSPTLVPTLTLPCYGAGCPPTPTPISTATPEPTGTPAPDVCVLENGRWEPTGEDFPAFLDFTKWCDATVVATVGDFRLFQRIGPSGRNPEALYDALLTYSSLPCVTNSAGSCIMREPGASFAVRCVAAMDTDVFWVSTQRCFTSGDHDWVAMRLGAEHDILLTLSGIAASLSE